MGTNYYLYPRGRCPCCGSLPDERLHIGKSSAGWCFSLRVDDGHKDLDDWIAEWSESGAYIEDEYGNEVTKEAMFRIITERCAPGQVPKRPEKPYGYSSWDEFHLANGSEDGPCGLIRRKVDGTFCIGHGDGPWDLVRGEFR